MPGGYSGIPGKTQNGVLEGVCITGGEPTLQPDLEEFIRKVRSLGLAVKLDTNGYMPGILKDLCTKGLLDCVAMDIKSRGGITMKKQPEFPAFPWNG